MNYIVIGDDLNTSGINITNGPGSIAIGSAATWSGYIAEPRPVEMNIATLNPNEQKLTIVGPVELEKQTEFKSETKFNNGIEIGKNECSSCGEEKGTIKCNELAICIECITDCVIQHKARVSWIEKHGDPILKLQRQIDELKQKIDK